MVCNFCSSLLKQTCTSGCRYKQRQTSDIYLFTTTFTTLHIVYLPPATSKWFIFDTDCKIPTANIYWDRVFKRCSRITRKNTKPTSYWPFVRGIHWWWVDSPHKGKVFPCHDVAMHAWRYRFGPFSDVIMSAMASQITGVSIVYSTVCSGADQRNHHRSASLAFVGEFPSQRASDAENVSIWWRHHEISRL